MENQQEKEGMRKECENKGRGGCGKDGTEECGAMTKLEYKKL